MSLILARIAKNHRGVGSGDPYWNNVVSLLHFDGSNNSTSIVDEKGLAWSCTGTTKISTTQSKFGTASAAWPSSSSSNKIVGPSTLGLFASDFTVEFWFYPILNSSNYSACLLGVDRTGGPRGVQFGWEGTVSGSLVGGSGFSSSNSAVLNTWNYFAFAANGNTAKINLNGIITSGVWTSGQGNVANAMTFGAHVDGITDWQGYIDECRLTKGVARDITLVPSASFPNHA